MAATFTWAEWNGAGSTETVGRTDMNWKNIDTSAADYTTYPITAGNNSYDKFQYGKFGGTWNQITNIKFDQTAGTLGAGLTLYASKSMAAAGDRVSYRTPVTSAAAVNATTITTNASFPTGARTLYASATGPDTAGTASVTGGGIAYTNFIYTKLSTTGAAGAGDTASITFTLQYDRLVPQRGDMLRVGRN